MLKIDKNYYKEIELYYIGYLTFKEIANWKINKMISHFEEKNGNKYLVLDDIN